MHFEAKSRLVGPNVALLEGSFTNEDVLRKGLRACQYAWVNIDGVNSGEKTEVFWAIRIYEPALEEGVMFFVYGNLDYAYKLGGYDPQYRCGHYDVKGRVGDWILHENLNDRQRMGAALFTTGQYMEVSMGAMTTMSPINDGDGTVVWRVPLGEGAIPHVALDDCGMYVRWLFDHQDEANGVNLGVALDPVHYKDVAAAFEKVTGNKARYEDVTLEVYWKIGPLAPIATRPAGYNASPDDPGTMSFKDYFTAWWNCWRASDKNQGLVRRDYALLGRIHPQRIRSVEQCFVREGEKGRTAGLGGLYERAAALRPVLKLGEDGFQGRI